MCEYCEKGENNTTIYNNGYWVKITKKTKHYYLQILKNSDWLSLDLKIEHCFKCGRQLKENKNGIQSR